jgi:hypothetical protein
MALDASNEKAVSVSLRILNKVRRSLLSRDGDKGHALISGLEPDDLRPLSGYALRTLISTITLPFPPLGFLLLLGGSGRRAEQAQGTREELAWHTFDDGDDVAGELRLDFIRNFFIFKQAQALAFNFDVVFLLLVLPADWGTHIVGGVFFFLALLLLFFFLGGPNLVHIEKLDSDDITLERAVTILRATDVDIGIQNLSRDVGIRAITLVDTKDTNDELAGSKKRRQGSLRQVRGEKRLALRLVLLLQLHLELLLLLKEIDSAQAHHVRSHHIREHVREVERGHLGVVSARCGAELSETLELCLCLSKIGLIPVACTDSGSTTV